MNEKECMAIDNVVHSPLFSPGSVKKLLIIISFTLFNNITMSKTILTLSNLCVCI